MPASSISFALFKISAERLQVIGGRQGIGTDFDLYTPFYKVFKEIDATFWHDQIWGLDSDTFLGAGKCLNQQLSGITAAAEGFCFVLSWNIVGENYIAPM